MFLKQSLIKPGLIQPIFHIIDNDYFDVNFIISETTSSPLS